MFNRKMHPAKPGVFYQNGGTFPGKTTRFNGIGWFFAAVHVVRRTKDHRPKQEPMAFHKKRGLREMKRDQAKYWTAALNICRS